MAGHRSETPSGYRERNSTADRALDILQLFDDDRLVITGAEIAERLSVARSTAYRYVQTLTYSGFLEDSQYQTGYRLGPRLLELARLARKGIGISEIARPVMRELVAATEETVLLTRRSSGSVVCLELEESDHPIRLSYERGHILPPNAGAAAYGLIAWESDTVVEDVLSAATLAEFTASTITDSAGIRARLARIRADGYAISRGELDENVVGIAAPIRDYAGTVVAAISIAGLSTRVTEARVPAIVEAVTAAGARITEQLVRHTA